MENPDDLSTCVIPISFPAPTIVPTDDPFAPTESPTSTPDCASDLIRVRFSRFESFGLVRLEVVNNRYAVGPWTDFEINWPKWSSAIMLARVTAYAPPGQPGSVTVWESGNVLQDNTSPTNGHTEGNWVSNFTFDQRSITPIYLDFDGNSSTLSSIGAIPSDFNGSWFEIGCGSSSGGGGNGRNFFEEMQTPNSANTPTVTSQAVVVRDRSGLKVGEGIVRLFAPDTLQLDETGEIRVEIEVLQPNAQFTVITNLAALPTATPDIRIHPTNTPPPLTENYAITVFEYMGVDMAGIGLSNLTLDPIPPAGTQHFTEPDQMHTWQWDIQATDHDALGEHRLRGEVSLSDVEGNRYELAIDSIPFTVEVVEPLQAIDSAALSTATPLQDADEGGGSGGSGKMNMPSSADSPPIVIGVVLAVVGLIGIGTLIVLRRRHKPSVFISYRRIPSATLATLIAKELEKHGIQVFLDTRSVDGGGLFPRRLIEAIHSNDVFVCLVADTTFESDWVREEIANAHTIGKTMIPVFQESWEHLNPKPQAPTEHIKALLDSDGVHLLDIRNVYVDEALEELAKMVRATARRNMMQV